MTGTEDDTAEQGAPAAPARRNHFRRAGGPKLAPDAASRQGKVTKLALDTLGEKDAAIAYLNLDSTKLGGRPLDLATASAEGLKQVELDLAGMNGGSASPAAA